jgi:hypothetical protein
MAFAISDAVADACVVLLAFPAGAVPQLLAEHGPGPARAHSDRATNDIGEERLHHAGVEQLIADVRLWLTPQRGLRRSRRRFHAKRHSAPADGADCCNAWKAKALPGGCSAAPA